MVTKYIASYSGVVQKGTKRAATLGFPTVNIPLNDAGITGIFAARVSFGGEKHPAAAFADQKRKVLEAHLLDTSIELYGKEVTIKLLKKLRDNKMFENDDDLRAAIADDVAHVRDYFKKNPAAA